MAVHYDIQTPKVKTFSEIPCGHYYVILPRSERIRPEINSTLDFLLRI